MDGDCSEVTVSFVRRFGSSSKYARRQIPRYMLMLHKQTSGTVSVGTIMATVGPFQAGPLEKRVDLFSNSRVPSSILDAKR
jgi:hypothetical protein